jgi:alcohol dehydrogenase class IV
VTRLADRQIEIVLRNRVSFGVGSIARLPDVVGAAGGTRVFVVTDPGVRRAGIVDPILDGLAAVNLATAVFDEVEPNPGEATIERGATALRAFGDRECRIVRTG